MTHQGNFALTGHADAKSEALEAGGFRSLTQTSLAQLARCMSRPPKNADGLIDQSCAESFATDFDKTLRKQASKQASKQLEPLQNLDWPLFPARLPHSIQHPQ